RPVRGERLAVAHLDGGGSLGRLHLDAGRDVGVVGDALVVGEDGLPLVVRQLVPGLGAGKRGGTLVNQQHVPHGFLLFGMVAYKTNEERRNRQPDRKPRRVPRPLANAGASIPAWTRISSAASRATKRCFATSTRPCQAADGRARKG